MKTLCFLTFYTIPVLALSSVSAAQAGAPDTCWRPMDVGTDLPVQVTATPGSQAKLIFHAIAETPVQRLPGAEAPDDPNEPIPAGTLVELTMDGGRVLVERGPVELVRGNARYAVADPPGLDLRLSATKRTKITLKDAAIGGKLPAGARAEILLSDAPLDVTLSPPISLAPIPPRWENARIDVGALPWTRGGRPFLIVLNAPGFNQSQLASGVFRSCFYAQQKDSYQAIGGLVDVLQAQDGRATLRVLVPVDFNHLTSLHKRVNIQILGPALGIISNEDSIYVNNPYVAFILSLLAAMVLFLVIARSVKYSGTSQGLGKLFAFVEDRGGQQSLSRFQILIWTALVLVGMLYVFGMSGDLLNISQQVLVLLGLAGAGAIGAQWLDGKDAKQTEEKASGFWGMFVINGTPDLLRLQLFVFTIAIWFYVAVRLFYEQEFPELDPNVLLLMGITNGVYVAGKAAGNAASGVGVGPRCAELTRHLQDEENKRSEVANLEAKLNELRDPASQQAKAGKAQELADTQAALEEAKKEWDLLKQVRQEIWRALQQDFGQLT